MSWFPPIDQLPTAMPELKAAPLTSNDVRTLALSALGGALEFYDFIIFIYFSTTIAALFFPQDIPDWLRQMQVLGIFAAGYLIRPIGGMVMAHYGDLLGRKKVFMLSILLMAVPTLIIGMLPTYRDIGLAAPVLLLVMRILQGAAVGGEVPGSWVFVGEHVSQKRLGFACGVLSAGLTAGILLGSLAANLINALFTPEQLLNFAWRLPFFCGGVFGLMAVFLRRYLQETPVFKDLAQQKRLASEMPVKMVISNHLREVLMSMGLTWLLSASIIVMILMMPMMMQKIASVSVTESLRINAFATLALIIGCILFGLLADKFGILRVIKAGCSTLALAALVLFWGLPNADAGLSSLYLCCTLLVGVVGVLPAIMVSIFPPEIRYSGLSFSYNIAYALFGGLTPVSLGFVIMHDAMAPGYYLAVLCGLAIVIVSAHSFKQSWLCLFADQLV